MTNQSNILYGPKFVFEFPKDFTIGQLMYDQIQGHGTKIAQIQKETGEELTYNQIFDKSRKLSIYLRSKGVKANDRIAICSENNLGWVVPACATLFVGATLCPINPLYSSREFQHTLNISKPNYIFVSPLAFDQTKEYIKELSWTPTLILMLDQMGIDIPTVEELISNIPSSSLDAFEVTNVDPVDHVVSILCSSGTTGLPKGVMLTDRNYLVNMQTLLDGSVGLAEDGQVIICLLPFFHSYCFNVFLMGIIAGSKAIVFQHFDEEGFLETIEKYKIPVLALVPPIMVLLAKSSLVDKYDLSSVKIIWSGAAPLSRDVELAVKNRLNNPDIRQGYGMTETTLSVLKVPENSYKPGSAGVLVSGIAAKVVPVDESGNIQSNKALGPNQEGELCFKGEIIMKGYCGDKHSTSATIDEDGWLHTGDIGYYDNDGYFYIVDRLKELIKYKGFQVPPAELEAILLTHPEIKDAAVVGLPNEEAGELPVAFVVKQKNSTLKAEDIIKFVNGQVSNQKKLRGGVKFINEIPKNQTGKILRRELRELLKSKL